MCNQINTILTVILVCFFVPRLASAQVDWDKEIEIKKNLEDSLRARGYELGFEGYLGSIYNEFNIREHSCTILGKMLGKDHFVEQLEKSNSFKSSEDPFELILASHSTTNWIHIANLYKDRSKVYLIRLWNLICVGEFDIPSYAYIEDMGSQTLFELSDDKIHLTILGDIEDGFFFELQDVLHKNINIKYIHLGSGGGYIGEAILAGQEIRRLGIRTQLYANCYSACILVFLGGVERLIWSPYPKLGFHQISSVSGAIPFDSPVYGIVADYTENMGVDALSLISYMKEASPDEFYYPHVDNLCKSRISTWIQRICSDDDYSE